MNYLYSLPKDLRDLLSCYLNYRHLCCLTSIYNEIWKNKNHYSIQDLRYNEVKQKITEIITKQQLINKIKLFTMLFYLCEVPETYNYPPLNNMEYLTIINKVLKDLQYKEELFLLELDFNKSKSSDIFKLGFIGAYVVNEI